MEKETNILPKEYTDEIRQMLGADYEKYLSAMRLSPVRGLRVNLKRISTKEFLKQTSLELEKLKFSDDGFVLHSDDKLGNSFEHLSGLFYLQEPSSMIAVCASGIESEKRPLKILDLCASPGGKTGQIAMRVSDDSLIVSNEIISSRAAVLGQNIERQGLKNVVTLNEQPEKLEIFENFFDYVFVDAPCSGQGMFRKNPETISEWSKDIEKMCSQRQREILKVATKLVKPGGKLIYSTCTFSKLEDEEIVDFILSGDEFELQEVPEEIQRVTVPGSGNLGLFRKFFPHTGQGEGQFVAVLRKKEGDFDTKLYSKKHFRSVFQIGQSDNKLVQAFCNLNLNSEISWKNLFSVGQKIFYSKVIDSRFQTALDELKFVSLGVSLGEIVKGRFEPNHNFFMAFDREFKRRIELSDEQARAYLHGEEILISEDKGYGVVTKNGFPLGGVKICDGRLKNLYPKGLRI